jgi:acetyl-CoA carboxylase carboxyltransferase component
VTNENDGDEFWQSGFLDRDSFTEVLSGWAKTVIVGRGRFEQTNRLLLIVNNTENAPAVLDWEESLSV